MFGSVANAQSEAPVPEKSVEVILGIDKIMQLDFAPDPRIQIGNEAILRTTLIPQRREIVLQGQKSGKNLCGHKGFSGKYQGQIFGNHNCYKPV